MPRSPVVIITLADGTVQTYKDVQYFTVNNAKINAADKRPESCFLQVTLPAERLTKASS